MQSIQGQAAGAEEEDSGGTYVGKAGPACRFWEASAHRRLTDKYVEYFLVKLTVFHFKACLFFARCQKGRTCH